MWYLFAVIVSVHTATPSYAPTRTTTEQAVAVWSNCYSRELTQGTVGSHVTVCDVSYRQIRGGR